MQIDIILTLQGQYYEIERKSMSTLFIFPQIHHGRRCCQP